MKSVFCFFFAFAFALLSSNQTVNAQSVLPFETVMGTYMANHPLYAQALLQGDRAGFELLAAKGKFDPKVSFDFDNKLFDGTQYYNLADATIKWPTNLYGLEVKAGYQMANGQYLNPERKLPNAGQPYLGVSLPLWANLRIDERRAGILYAKTNISQAAYLQQAAINDLFLVISESYWKWAFAYQQQLIYAEAFDNAQIRFQQTKRAFELGDRMAMDTLESYIQVQDRSQQLLDAKQVWVAASQKLAAQIWPDLLNNTTLDDQIPSPIAEIKMDSITTETEQKWMAQLADHPIIRGYELQLDQLDVEKRLKREKLKPELVVHYNLIGKGITYQDNMFSNYKGGITLRSNTLFREPKAQLEITKLKINTYEYELRYKVASLQNQLRTEILSSRLLFNQYQVQQATTQNLQKLYQLEVRRFELGESSFFLINSRESKYLEAQVKLAKLTYEVQIASAKVVWAAGGQK